MKVKNRKSFSAFSMFSTIFTKYFYVTVIIAVIATCSFVSSLNDSNDLIISLAEKNALDKVFIMLSLKFCQNCMEFQLEVISG